MSTRRPLGESIGGNLPQVIEGRNDGIDRGTFGKNTVRTKKSIAELRQDLDRAKARLHKQDQPKGPVHQTKDKQSTDLEKRLQDLVEAHASSKSRYKAELEALTAANAELRSLQDNARLEHRSVQKENERLQSELRRLRSTATASTSSAQQQVEERAAWQQEKKALSKEIDQLRAEAIALQVRSEELDEIEYERDRLEEALDITVKQYGKQAMTNVPRSEYERFRRENERLRMEALSSQEVASRLELRNKITNEKLELMEERLAHTEAARDEAERIVRDLLEERRLDRQQGQSGPPKDTNIPDLEHGVDTVGILDLALKHSDIATLNAQIQTRNTLLAYRDLFESSEKASAAQASTRATLTSLQRAHAKLDNSFKDLEGAHAPCGSMIQGLNGEIERWQQSEMQVAEELKKMKFELKKLEDKSRGDRESLKRANDSAMRRQFAEDALEEEIVTLRSALEEARDYQEMYENLMEEYRVMSERENLAHEEVERLGSQNAELIGHTNGDQKISYVESVRREMALTKHELATTRHLLNNAQDRVNTLTQEVESYKSVEDPMNLGASTRTRIARRVPEGTWLGRSVRGRSVSGPTGR